MRAVTESLKNDAVYWAPDRSGTVPFDEFGRPIHTTPVQVRCRWENTQQEFTDPQGTRRISRAIIFVVQDMEVGGKIMLGTLDDLDSTLEPPTQNEGFDIWEILTFERTEDLRDSDVVRTVIV